MRSIVVKRCNIYCISRSPNCCHVGMGKYPWKASSNGRSADHHSSHTFPWLGFLVAIKRSFYVEELLNQSKQSGMTTCIAQVLDMYFPVINPVIKPTTRIWTTYLIGEKRVDDNLWQQQASTNFHLLKDIISPLMDVNYMFWMKIISLDRKGRGSCWKCPQHGWATGYEL